MMRSPKTSELENMRAPDALRELKGWLVWRWVQRPGKAKASKVPYYITGEARKGTQGSESDRSKMATFDEAKAFAIRHNFPGVGFAFMPEFGITGLDFDDCVIDGKVDPRVEEITAGTYTEFSPSGNGVHAFVVGAYPDHKDSPPRNPERDAFGCETFHEKGFLTFTGHATELTELTDCTNTLAHLTQPVVDYFGTRFVHVRELREKYEGEGKPVFGMSEEQIETYLKQLPEDLSYDEWVKVGMAVHHETYGEGFALWDEWSSNSPKYTDTAYSLARWESFGVNNSAEYTTMGTVLQMLRQSGLETGFEVADPGEFENLGVDPTLPKGGKFNIRSQGDFAREVKPLSWLIKNFLPKGAVGVLFGESGSGKSFLTYDLCAAIARGLDEWNGKRVKKGRVLYVVAEGEAGFVNRIHAYCEFKGISADDCEIDYISDFIPNLMTPSLITDLIREIKARGEYELVVMDTFAQVMVGANENSGEDVGKALFECGRIHRHTGAMVLLIHHSGKDAAKGSRGWSGIKGACDVQLEVTRSDNDRAVTSEKVKDGADKEQIGFKLRTVVIGEDEDGDDITSCVVEYGEVSARMKAGKGPKGIVQKLAFNKAHDLIGLANGEISVDELVAVMVSEMVLKDGERDQRKGVAARAITSLIKSEKLVETSPGRLGLPEE